MIKSNSLTIAWICLFMFGSVSCRASKTSYSDPQSKGILQSALNEISSYVDTLDADVGVCIIDPSGEAIAINGDRAYPMMSVYKFPIALAVAEQCRRLGKDFSDTITFNTSELNLSTYSPMLSDISSGEGKRHKMPVKRLLEYALIQSDNNASDLLLRFAGGAKRVDEYIRQIGAHGIKIRWSEDEMYADNSRSYDNSSTPAAMARLWQIFYNEFNDSLSLQIKGIMEACDTGKDRIPASVADADVRIAHKTGTGFMLPDHRIMAINDSGYVSLPDGRCYIIVVFVARSGLSPDATSAIIARISSIAYNALK